jgi:peptidoglycan/xylan/chitin deacetylase (PgdA/CDA1 family)
MFLFVIVLGLIVVIWFLLYPFADLYGRFSGNVPRRMAESSMVGLTFDDGPDPLYTPVILDILKQYGATATFFVVGRQAKAYPDIIRRISDEGHELALHTQNHRNAYTLFAKTFSEVAACQATVEKIAGVKPHWFRPPWGAFNALLFPAVLRCGLSPVLWSVNANDWLVATGSEGIRQLIRQRIHPGAIIVLHDHGGESGAPANTVKALPDILSDLRQSGLQPVSLAHMSSKRE